MQPLQNCIGPTIRILCLPYAGFFSLSFFLKKKSRNLSTKKNKINCATS